MAAPQKTVTSILAAVRDNIDEATAVFWSDAKLIRNIDRAKDYVWAEVRKLKRGYFEVTRTSADGSVTILGDSYATSNLAIAAGTGTYTLPPDFTEMVEFRATTAGYEHIPFIYKAPTDPLWQAMKRHDGTGTTSSPSGFFYTIRGERTMVITPLSDTALATSITYVRILPELTTGSDTLEAPHPLHICVEEVATWRAQLQDRDPSAGAWSQVAQASVQRFFGSHARQSTDYEAVPDTF